MFGYYTPAEIAEMHKNRPGYGESTIRARANNGEFVNAVKRGNTWFIPLSDLNHIGRGYDREFAEPQKLFPDLPADPTDIVLAQNSDGKYGIYIDEEWHSAGPALVMLEYLQKHRAWLEEKARENLEKE